MDKDTIIFSKTKKLENGVVAEVKVLENKDGICSTESFLAVVRKMFNDENSSDVFLSFGSKKYFCHSIVIFNGVLLFRRMKDKGFFKKEKKTLKNGTEKSFLVIDINDFVNEVDHGRRRKQQRNANHKTITTKDGPHIAIEQKIDLEVDEFELLLKFLYFGTFPFPPSHKELHWLKICQFFEIETLYHKILSYLGTWFTLSDCLTHIEQIRMSGNVDLLKVCLSILEAHDSVIFEKTEKYLELSLPIIQYFVKDGRLSIEEEVFIQKIVHYCEKTYQKTMKRKAKEEEEEVKYYESPKEMFKEEFEKYFRYPLISPNLLFTVVEPIGWIEKEYLLEAYKFNSAPQSYSSSNDSLSSSGGGSGGSGGGGKNGKGGVTLSIRTKERKFPPGMRFKGCSTLNPKLQMTLFRMIKENCGGNKRMILLYKGSIDGFSANSFHSTCDGKGATITIVVTEEGDIFGGYTSIPWKGHPSRYAKDTSAWLFHLKSRGIEDPYVMESKKTSANHVYHFASYGPSFGANFDLYISNTMQSTLSSYTNVGNSYVVPAGKSKQLSTNYNFKVSEIEVFEVI